MAEHKILGPSSYLIYVFFLGVLCLSTCCSGENHVSYEIVSPLHAPSESLIVPNIVSHPRLRRQVSDGSPQPGNESVAPTPAVDSTGAPSLSDAPSNDDISSNSTSTPSNSTSSPGTQSGNGTDTGTATTTTSNPYDDLPIIEDSKDYYVVKSNIQDFDGHWKELKTATRHVRLSKSHRLAAVISLGFKFPFYGHLVDNITIATGGFIYMSPFLHQLLTATQYIAPLMANFDLSISPDSNIYYLNMTDAMYVEWRNVILQDQNSTGSFTFQAILNASGQITFVYKDVPVSLSDISKRKHPVKVGLSDAYYNDTYDRTLRIRRRTIYEYHRVSVNMETVRSKSVVVLEPLPTCNTLTDCTSCTEHAGVNFDCQWCNTIGRCSNGLDWYRQHWDRYGCQRTKFADPALCQRFTFPMSPRSTTTSATVPTSSPHSESTSTTVETTTMQTSQSPSTRISSSSTTESTTSSQETPATPTTSIGTTATLPPTVSTEKPTPSKSTSSSTETSPESTSRTTETTSKSTSSTTETTSKSTSRTTETTSKSTSRTTPTSSKSTSRTTETTSKSTSGTTPTSSESTSRTTETTSKSTSPTTQTSSKSTMIDDGGVVMPLKHRDNGYCDLITAFEACSNLPPPSVPITDPINHPMPHSNDCKNGNCGSGSSTPEAVIIIVIVLIAGLLAGIGGWVFYAYTHPTSKSGMWLMEHRPSQMKAKIQFWKSSSDSGAAKYKMESEA